MKLLCFHSILSDLDASVLNGTSSGFVLGPSEVAQKVRACLSAGRE